MSRNVQQPTSIVHTDTTGAFAAEVAKVTPVTGVDYGIPVYANLGSATIAVDQITSGAATLGTGQATLGSGSATQLLAARATRRSAIVSNLDTTITIYVGNSGVTAATGQAIKSGNSLTIPFVGAIYAIGASGAPVCSFAEAYD